MKSKLLTIFLLLVFIGVFLFLGKLIFLRSAPGQLISSKLTTQVPFIEQPTSTPTPTPTPIIFHFDKSTNLKSELETINPEVQDNDFDSLKKIISQL